MNPSSGENFPEPPNLRFLRRLVTVLTATMILGLVVIIALLVIRFSGTPPDALPLEISLPEGVDPVSVTYAKNWYLVVGTDNQIYVYDRRSHELIQQTLITQQ